MLQRACWSLFAFTAAMLAQGNPDWHRPFPAFKIAGDLYYVGTADLAAYLVVTPQGNILINSNFEQDLPLIAQDYVKTFAVLKSLPCDLFLGAHGAYFGLKAKHEKMKAGARNPFIDPDGYKAYVAEREATFQKEWQRQRENPGSPAR